MTDLQTSRAFLTVYLLLLMGSVSCMASPKHRKLTYDRSGDLIVSKQYREWIYLSAGLDMVYGPQPSGSPDPSRFDNVFVSPDSYRKFLTTGIWPDKTVFVLEMREAERNVSINSGGRTQGAKVLSIEIHVKDKARFKDEWAFFEGASSGRATLIPRPAACYTCHEQHAAVDTTFVQFYPILLPIAGVHSTLSTAYLSDVGNK